MASMTWLNDLKHISECLFCCSSVRMPCASAKSLGLCKCLEAMLKNLMPLPDTARSGPERRWMWQPAHAPSPASMLQHAVPRRVQPMQPCPGNICKI